MVSFWVGSSLGIPNKCYKLVGLKSRVFILEGHKMCLVRIIYSYMDSVDNNEQHMNIQSLVSQRMINQFAYVNLLHSNVNYVSICMHLYKLLDVLTWWCFLFGWKLSGRPRQLILFCFYESDNEFYLIANYLQTWIHECTTSSISKQLFEEIKLVKFFQICFHFLALKCNVPLFVKT